MENLASNLILLNWVNATESPVQISWSGGPNMVELLPHEPTPIYEATLSDLNVLFIHIQNDAAGESNPNLLFTGVVQCAINVFQQRTLGTPWITVEYHRHLAQTHYSITLAADADGLVIVGTVELVDPIPVPTH
jgi:hypothetical protein